MTLAKAKGAVADSADSANVNDEPASENPKLAPIVLPAGSYDVDDLKKGLNAVSRSSAAKHDETLANALDNAKADGTVLEQVDRAFQEGHEVVEVEHPLLGIKENLRVYTASDEAAADSGNTKE